MNLKPFRMFMESAISEETLNEMVKLDKYNLYAKDAQEVSSLLKQASSETDDKKAKKLYQKALSNAEALRKAAKSLPDDDAVDWIFNLFCKPWWWFLADVISASSKGDPITAMSRSQAVSHYDTLIRQIKNKIDALD